jgi:hypothetical protein
MSHVAARRWVVAAACALAGYALVLTALLVWSAGQGGDEIRDLNGIAAAVAGLLLGLPTVVLAILLFVSRFARAVGAIAIAWMGFSAFVWLPVQPGLAAVAGGVALVILGAMVLDRRRTTGGSNRSSPQR